MSITKLIPLLLVSIISTISIAEDLHIISKSSDNCISKTEICGNGIDEDCNGSDEPCIGTDRDADGFSGTNDCDDNDPYIHVGTSTSCNASCGDGRKTCLTSGSFSNCDCTALCEAPSGGNCYYVDPINGNNANNGSYSSRKKNLSPFSTTGSGTERIILKAGDRVYIFGGILSPQNSSSPILSIIGTKGTDTNPIVFTNYPGNSPVLEGTADQASIYLVNSSYIKVIGMTFKSEGTPIKIETSNNLNFDKLFITISSSEALPKISVYNSNKINFNGMNILKNSQNTNPSDTILSVNSNNISFSHGYIE